MPIVSLGTDGFVATGKGVEFVRLVSLRGALRLEMLGMKRRGRSALVVCKELLGVSRHASRDEVLAKLEARIDELRREVQNEPGSGGTGGEK